MPPGRTRTAGAPAGGSKRLKYEQVRDGFLAETPATAEEELHYFTRIGMYVFARWQAIADDHEPGQQIDEAACDVRWDECTVRDFQKVRNDAQKLIAKEMRRGRAAALWESWKESWAPVKWVLNSLSWILWRMLEHFFGAVGLLLFGLLLIWLAPRIVKEAREAFDATLPAQTRPVDENATAPAQHVPRNGAEAASGVDANAANGGSGR